MATGDLIVFDEGKRNMQLWDGADVLKCAILDNTTAPTAADATPELSDYTEVGTGGNYVAGGVSLGTWAAFLTESAGTVKYDSATNPNWPQDAGNDNDAFWGLVYNDTNGTNQAFAFVELGGPVDMSAGSLTVTWNAAGLATLT